MLTLALIVTILVIYAALKPSTFRIVREVKISAPPEVIFMNINNSKNFDVWNPWSKLDPQMKKGFEGPDSGVGSITTWDGNSQVGAGKSTVTESVPNSLVRMRLDYMKPFQSTSNAEFTLKPEGTETVVSWSISGESPFINRFVCIFMNMDKMIGGIFDKGLADLKHISEAAAGQK